MAGTVLRNKFRGCLLGALAGDCLGSPFEFINVRFSEVTKLFDRLEDNEEVELELTDDTQMTQELADSLIEKKSLDSTDLAERFTKRYFCDGMNAGYGMHVVNVFEKLVESNYEDPLRPAREQFNGSGSLGNGSAMRVAPAALFAYPDLKLTAEIADKSSLLTHTHILGRHGAVFQALAVRRCILEFSSAQEFLSHFREDLKEVNICKEYLDAVSVVENLLLKPRVTDTEVESKLGNGVRALQSVPTALFCFLLSLNPITGFPNTNAFRRTLEYAINLGGDTDTIASMAGALAGAYYGVAAINENIIKSCPDSQKAVNQADALLELVQSRTAAS